MRARVRVFRVSRHFPSVETPVSSASVYFPFRTQFLPFRGEFRAVILLRTEKRGEPKLPISVSIWSIQAIRSCSRVFVFLPLKTPCIRPDTSRFQSNSKVRDPKGDHNDGFNRDEVSLEARPRFDRSVYDFQPRNEPSTSEPTMFAGVAHLQPPCRVMACCTGRD